MNYNFDEIIKRRGSNCVKWDEAEEDIMPLWIADMDFKVYPGITEAMRKRLDHEVFGYTLVPQSYYDSVLNWFGNRHGAKGWKREHIIITIGVVPAISAIVHALTLPGDKVLMTTPIYNCFYSSIRNQGALVEELPLLLDEKKNGKDEHAFTIDWDGFEKACADPNVRIFLLCNPHNPSGRVWTKEELMRIGEICFKNNVLVVSDEIHCEFVSDGYKYIPFSSLGEEFLQNSVTCVAASKAFNVAGLQTANIIVADPDKRYRINRAVNIFETCDVNPFGIVAVEAAYTDGGAEWLKQFNDYVQGNYDYLVSQFAEKLPQLWVSPHESTYLAWVDCSAFGKSSTEIKDYLYNNYKVWLCDGLCYGEKQRAFLRINLACPHSILAEGLQRMIAGLQSL
ncbi:MalY/PatB family protein [Prevotella koreensis]